MTEALLVEGEGRKLEGKTPPWRWKFSAVEKGEEQKNPKKHSKLRSRLFFRFFSAFFSSSWEGGRGRKRWEGF